MGLLQYLGNAWHAITKGGGPPTGYAYQWGGGSTFSDAFLSRRAPTPAQLVDNYKSLVYACVNHNVNGVLRAPLRLYATTSAGQHRPKCGIKALGPTRYSRLKRLHRLKSLYGDTKAMAHADEVEEVTDHPLLDAVMKVNEDLDHSSLLAYTVMSLDITGNAYWWPNLGAYKIPEELWALPPHLVYPIWTTGTMVPDQYQFGGVLYPKQDLIRFKRLSAKNPYGQGYGPEQAAIEYARLEDTFVSIQDDMLANGPRPSIIISHKDPKGAFGTAERDRLEHEANRKGRGGRSGSVLVVDGAAAVTPVSYTPADLGGLSISSYDMERICNCFGVPVSMMKTDDVNRANAEAGLEQHARDAIEPRCRAIASTLTRWTHSLDPKGARNWDRLFWAFDGVVREDQQAEAELHKIYFAMGLPTNKILTEAGYDSVEGGDASLVPNSLATLTSIVSPPEQPEAAPGEDPEDEEPEPSPDDEDVEQEAEQTDDGEEDAEPDEDTGKLLAHAAGLVLKAEAATGREWDDLRWADDLDDETGELVAMTAKVLDTIEDQCGFTWDGKAPCRDERGRFTSCGGGTAAGGKKPPKKPSAKPKPAKPAAPKKPAEKPKPKPAEKPKPKPSKPEKPAAPKPEKPKPAAKPPKEPPAKPKPTAEKPAAKPKPEKPPKEKPAAKPAAEKPAAPKPAKPKGDFPDSPKGLEKVKDLGGSTGAKLVKDEHGRLFVQKSGASAGHLKEEGHADAAYAAMGVPVPKSKVYEVDGKPVKLAQYHEGKTLAELKASDPAAYEKAAAEVRKHFVADAVLGNWDVVGMHHDNILVTKSGGVLRIDNGGSLRYRAQGAKKSASQWSGDLGELKTMRDPAINPAAASVFGKLTDAEVRVQAKAVLAHRDAVLAAAPLDLRDTLKARFKTLEKVATGQPAIAAKVPPLTPKVDALAPKPHPAANPPKPAVPPLPAAQGWSPKPAHDFKEFHGPDQMEAWGKAHYEAWAKGLSLHEQAALRQYCAAEYHSMNGLLRGTLKDEHLTTEFGFGESRATIQKRVDYAAEGLRKGRAPEAVVGWRGISDHTTLGFHSLDQLHPGLEFTEKGFSSVSLHQSTAVSFAHPSGSDSARSVVFQVRVPKGATGGYVNAGHLSGADNERELLFPPAAKYRVVGRGPHVDHKGAKLPVVILERVD